MAGLGQQILIEAVLVPSGVGLAAALLGMRLSGRQPGVLAGALALGFLAGFELIRGLEFAWPRAATEKLPGVVLLGLTGSLIAGRGRPGAGALLAIAGPVLLVAARPLADGQIGRPLALVLVGLILWSALGARFAPRRSAWLLVAVALGLAGTAAFARTLLIAELALASAAVAGVALVRPPTSAGALLPAVSLPIGIGTALVLFSKAPAPALLLIALIPLVGRASPLLARWTRLREPLLMALLPLVLAALATGWTRWTHGPPLYF